MSLKSKELQTLAIHAGEFERVKGAVVHPVFQSSTYLYEEGTKHEDLKYIRLTNTPNHVTLHEKIRTLEGAEAALVTASGMAAISATLLSLLNNGDHLLAQDCLYGGTLAFVSRDLPSLGIEIDFIDAASPESWQQKLRPNTKAIYVEGISNPLMKAANLLALAKFAREVGVVSIIDNTFVTPVNLQPIAHGFDLVIHSCTKYMNGHSDIVAGALAGRADLVQEAKRRLNRLGGSLDPHACFLLQRGIKTLCLRMQQHNASAQKLAEFLETHPRIRKVNYPGLASSELDPKTRALFRGFGGMLSFELDGSVEEVNRFISDLELAIEAPSLGGPETLITRPATTSHSGQSREEREAVGITETLVRLSVGLEATEDLIEDFRQALRSS